MVLAVIASIACAALVALLVLAERKDDVRGRFRWKPMASAAFLLVPLAGGGLADGVDQRLALWIIVGLALGAVGDVALMFESERGFLGGLVAFLLGHLAYVIGLARVTAPARWFDGTMRVLAPVTIVVSLAILAWLWRRLGPMRIPVIVYVAVITTMAIGGLAVSVIADDTHASSRSRHLLTAGAIAFFASDLAVAREKFVGRDPWNRTLGLPVYYGAQLLFGWALVVR